MFILSMTFLTPKDLRPILQKISQKLAEDKFFLVAEGKAIGSLIQNDFKEFYVCFTPKHLDGYSIYSSYLDLE